MRPLLKRLPVTSIESLFLRPVSRITHQFSRPSSTTSFKPPLCWQCQSRVRSRWYSDTSKQPPLRDSRDREDIIKRTRSLESFSAPSSLEDVAETLRSSAREKDGNPRTSRVELPSQEEGRRWHISKRFTHVMDHLQSNIFLAGQRLNDLTGYSGIEALKKDIEEQEEIVRTSRSALRKVKDDYANAIAQRSASQREVNELLQRKHAWSAQDLERFTTLYRSDHSNERAEILAQEALTAAERVSEEAAGRLSTSILARYHEEQIWSDKIRRMSTWGTWGLMGVNVFLFFIFQIGVEPWRRARLVKGFEEKVMEALEREGAATNAAIAAVGASNRPVSYDEGPAQIASPETSVKGSNAATTEIVVPPEAQPPTPLSPELEETTPLIQNVSNLEPLSTIDGYKEAFRDMFSERHISLRKVDITTIALEGVAAGAALVGLLVVLLRPR